MNVGDVLIMERYETYSYFPSENWVFSNGLILLILLIVLMTYLRVRFYLLIIAAFAMFIVFSFFRPFFPIKAPQTYIYVENLKYEGLEDAEEGSGFCSKNCSFLAPYISMMEEPLIDHYSWKFIELNGGSMLYHSCCVEKRPFDNKYLFGFFLVLELTFEYLPLLFFVAILASLIEYKRRKRLEFFTWEFLSSDQADIRRINFCGVVLLLIVLLYNVAYINGL
jgi:hypothetical protein